MAFQSLYRRYRPGRFEELRGQDHVTLALRNAVRDGAVAHAYLFSGPRGTGKTSTARILAKALNCAAPVDGEPCGACESCLSVEAGRSLDVVELDAASNNGVDAMRDLVSRVALGTGGRAKVYILDEVHMLSTAASNALLKTLEEPPPHVTFVLATTDPQKVLPTIASRTQHFAFKLASAATLEEHLRWVAADAGLKAGDEAITQAVRRGKGSFRDALSCLDQLEAAGGGGDEDTSLDELTEALCEHDTGRALAAVAMASNAGREPRQLAESLLGHLRDVLLSVLAPDVVSLPDEAKAEAGDQGRRLGAAATVRALDAIGEALLAMREAPDPRVALEVALVRVTRPELDSSPVALLERLEKVERALRAGAYETTSTSTAPLAEASETAAPAPAATPATGPSAAARQAIADARPALGAVRQRAAAAPPERPAPGGASSPSPATSVAPVVPPLAEGTLPTREELTTAWGDAVLKGLRVKVKGLYGSGRFVAVDDAAVFGFQSDRLREMAEEVRPEVEAALGAHFGRRVPVRLVVMPEGTSVDVTDAADAQPADDEAHDPSELRDAPPDDRSGVDHLTTAFPGAEVLDVEA